MGHHVVLNYIAADGNHYTLQGLPQHSSKHNLEKLGAFVREEGLSTGENNRDSRFGRLQSDHHDQAIDELEFAVPHTMIAEGRDLKSQWDRMRKFADDVNSTGYEYRPYSQNSNSFAAGALRHAGLLGPGTALPEAFDHQIVFDPASGRTDSVSVPGFDRRLSNPLGEASSDGFDARFGNWPSRANGKSGDTSRRQAPDAPAASMFDSGASAIPFVPPNDFLSRDRHDFFNDRFGNSTSQEQTPQADPRFRELSSPVLPLGWSRSPQFAPNQAQQLPGKLIGIVTGQPFYPLLPSIFGLPDKSGSSGNEIEDMFARWIKSYGR